jgi:hypothetical protein
MCNIPTVAMLRMSLRSSAIARLLFKPYAPVAVATRKHQRKRAPEVHFVALASAHHRERAALAPTAKKTGAAAAVSLTPILAFRFPKQSTCRANIVQTGMWRLSARSTKSPILPGLSASAGNRRVTHGQIGKFGVGNRFRGGKRVSCPEADSASWPQSVGRPPRLFDSYR